VNAVGGSSREAKKLLQRIAGLTDDVRSRTERLAAVLNHHSSDTRKHARYMRDSVVPAMAALRESVDQVEPLMPHEVWPLPTYREMLFVK
jgi:glutamine synthetase